MTAKVADAKAESLASVFDQIEKLMKRYSPPFVVGPGGKVGPKRHYDLVSKKEVVIDGRPRTELYFASVIEQKGYIGFYLSTNPFRSQVSPRLLKLLQGKTCFHVKALDSDLLADVKAALDLALNHYKREGWI